MNAKLHTRWSNHALPLLKQRSLKAVTRIETVCFVSRHQLLHWLQYYAQLQPTEMPAMAVKQSTHGCNLLILFVHAMAEYIFHKMVSQKFFISLNPSLSFLESSCLKMFLNIDSKVILPSHTWVVVSAVLSEFCHLNYLLLHCIVLYHINSCLQVLSVQLCYIVEARRWHTHIHTRFHCTVPFSRLTYSRSGLPWLSTEMKFWNCCGICSYQQYPHPNNTFKMMKVLLYLLSTYSRQ